MVLSNSTFRLPGKWIGAHIRGERTTEDNKNKNKKRQKEKSGMQGKVIGHESGLQLLLLCGCHVPLYVWCTVFNQARAIARDMMMGSHGNLIASEARKWGEQITRAIESDE